MTQPREEAWEDEFDDILADGPQNGLLFVWPNGHTNWDAVKSFTRRLLSTERQRLLADYKDICPKCRGKGYHTETRGVRTLSKREQRPGATLSDFSGEPTDSFTEIEYCECERGKQLNKLITAKEVRHKEEMEKVRQEFGKELFIELQKELALVDTLPLKHAIEALQAIVLKRYSVLGDPLSHPLTKETKE